MRMLSANLMVKNLTRIKIGITINVGASVKIRKNILRAKKRLFLKSCDM